MLERLLVEEWEPAGGVIGDLQVFSLMSCTDVVIRSRYIETGYFHWPAPHSLDRTCKSLRQSVGRELKRANLPVRI